MFHQSKEELFITNQIQQKVDFPAQLSQSLLNSICVEPARLPPEKLTTALKLLSDIESRELAGVVTLLRFCLTEVLPLPTTKERQQLLFWHFQSIQSEYLRLPITSGAYKIELPQNRVQILDPRYQVRPDVLEVSSPTVSDPLLQARYSKEAQQIARLVDWLQQSLPVEQPSPTEPELAALGWQQTSELLTKSAAKKLSVKYRTPLWVGQKQFYCMPSSPVHEGGMSVLVVVQPAYNPTTKQWLLLHDQHMVQVTHQQLLRQFSKLGSGAATQLLQQPKESRKTQSENVLMAELIGLPPQTQLQSAQQVLLDIQNSLTFFSRIEQILKSRSLSKAEQSLSHLAEYVAEVLESEIIDTPTLTEKNLSFLAGVLENVVLKATFARERITHSTLNTLKAHYQNTRHQPIENFLLSAGNVLPSVFQSFDVSGLDCLLGLSRAPIELLTQNSAELLSSLQSGILNEKQLTEIVGKKRAQKWLKGVCVQQDLCKRKEMFGTQAVKEKTWIGECGWCIWCEQQADQLPQPAAQPSLPAKPSLKAPKKTSKSGKLNTAKPPLPPITLSYFLGSLL